MDTHELGAAEMQSKMQNNGSFKELFKEFLGDLAETYEPNKSNPPNLQKELKRLIKKGEDMIQNQQSEVRFELRHDCI